MNMLTLLLAVTLSSGNAEFDQVARDGAAEIAVGRIVAELKAKGAPRRHAGEGDACGEQPLCHARRGEGRL